MDTAATASASTPDHGAPSGDTPRNQANPDSGEPRGRKIQTTIPRAVDCSAVIYSPGLFEKEDGKSLAHFAERMARALDQQDPVIGYKFAARPARLETYGEVAYKREVEVREIVRLKPDGDAEVSHLIYYLDYETELAAAKTEKNWFTEAWALGTTLWVMATRYVRHGLRARSLGPNQKMALAVAGAGLVLLTAAFVFALHQALTLVKPGIPAPTFSFDWFWSGLAETARFLEPITLRLGGEHVNRGAVWCAELVSVIARWIAGGASEVWAWLSAAKAWLAAVGIGILSIKRVREELERALNIFLMSTRYFIAGRGRVKCTGRFNDLLEHVAETHPGRLDVIGYSMGSLVVLDALFPWRGTPAKRASRVTTLTTIGCPFDFVRGFWPLYFEGRTPGPSSLNWVNVYSPMDLLGSNFANSSGPSRGAKRGINDASPIASDPPEPPSPSPDRPVGTGPGTNLIYDHLGRRELRWMDALTGEAFSAHSQYWVRGDSEAESCLSVVVAAVYSFDEQKPPFDA